MRKTPYYNYKELFLFLKRSFEELNKANIKIFEAINLLQKANLNKNLL